MGEECNIEGPARDCWDKVVEGEQEGGHNGEGGEVRVARAAVREGKQEFGEKAGRAGLEDIGKRVEKKDGH